MSAEIIAAVEEVEGRLAAIKRERYRVATDFEADLCEWFGFQAGQARVLAVLYRAEAPVPEEILLARAGVHLGSMNKYMPRIREVLPSGAIPYLEKGFREYELSKEGRAACDEATAQVGIGVLRAKVVAALSKGVAA